jgi:hypothetical protein
MEEGANLMANIIQLQDNELLQTGIFSSREEELLITFIKSAVHRFEFYSLIMHCYNHQAYPHAMIAELLRYVEWSDAQEGLLLFLKTCSFGKGSERILSDRLFESIETKKSHSVRSNILQFK